MVTGTAKFIFGRFYFLVFWSALGALYLSQNSRELFLSHFPRQHLVLWTNYNFLHSSQWINFPTLLCVALYSCCIRLMHLFIMWLKVLFLSLYNRYLKICWAISVFALTYLVLTEFFSTVMRGASIYLWMFLLVSLSLEISVQLFFFLFLFPSFYCSVVIFKLLQ